MGTDKYSPTFLLRNFRRAVISRWRHFALGQRLRMASVEALPQLVFLGIASGLFAGLVIIVFRWVIESGQVQLLPGAVVGAYETLTPTLRLLLCAGGGLVVGLLFEFSPPLARQVGVVHVIERLNYHQGHLPLRNAALQFLGAALSIISGHSVGREGPSIHLGAATASLLGQRLALPNNSIRTLVGCGVAAAMQRALTHPLQA